MGPADKRWVCLARGARLIIARVKILYGVVGEGMGHAMRSAVILERLAAEGHELRIVGSAYSSEW